MTLLTVDQQRAAVAQRANRVDVVRGRDQASIAFRRMVDVGEQEEDVPSPEGRRVDSRPYRKRKYCVWLEASRELWNARLAGDDDAVQCSRYRQARAERVGATVLPARDGTYALPFCSQRRTRVLLSPVRRAGFPGPGRAIMATVPLCLQRRVEHQERGTPRHRNSAPNRHQFSSAPPRSYSAPVPFSSPLVAGRSSGERSSSLGRSAAQGNVQCESGMLGRAAALKISRSPKSRSARFRWQRCGRCL